MGLFLTGGFPSPAATGPLLHAVDAAGADFLELGMPHSDPLAEGLPIQRSSARALDHGIRMKDILRMAAAFRARSDTPLLLMGYVNPILQYGMGNFCRDAWSSGVDGLIVADLPPEEGYLLESLAAEHGLDLVYLIAPNTPNDRVRHIDARSSGFVYAVSVTGITGVGLDQRLEMVESYLERVGGLVKHNPVMVGFGIKTHTDAARLTKHTDGFIVGSALVDLIETLWSDETLHTETRVAQIWEFVKSLKVKQHE